MTKNFQISTPKVLVIAYPELACSIYEALHKRFNFNQSGIKEHHKELPTSLTQLCESAFASSIDSIYSAFNIFQWSNYDFVILQDIWLQGHLTEHQTLESAGFIFAVLEHYYLGNFRSKVIILLTDTAFVGQKATRTIEPVEIPVASDNLEILRNTFDEKGAFEFLQIVDSPANAIGNLVNILSGDASSTKPDRVGKKLEDIVELQEPVMQAATEALRKYINEQAEVIMVEDEASAINEIYHAIKASPQSNAGLREGQINIAISSRGFSLKDTSSFDNLVTACVEEYQESIKNQKRYVLFVTDIMFNLPGWYSTGIDLIEALRKELGHHIGIVAFTGFASPFITMSAYQRGADLVVQKGSLVPSRHHSAIVASGVDRLLISLASLSFQKVFLRNKRNECLNKLSSQTVSERYNTVKQSLQQLQTILPKHTVSLHLHQEWLDTYYLFQALNTYNID